MADALVLMTIASPGGVPDLARAASILGVDPSAMDTAFGVVLIDPEKGMYAVQVSASAVSNSGKAAEGVKGPYSNPRIEGYGPKTDG
jgi:hypothetical protein